MPETMCVARGRGKLLLQWVDEFSVSIIKEVHHANGPTFLQLVKQWLGLDAEMHSHHHYLTPDVLCCRAGIS